MEAPNDREAELGVIGCCLLGGQETVSAALDTIPPDSFASEDCRAAYDMLCALLASGAAISEMALREMWAKAMPGTKFPEAVSQAADDVPSHESLGYFTERTLDASARRRLFWAAHDVMMGMQDKTRTVQECLSAAEAKLFDAAPNLPKAYLGKACAGHFIDDSEDRWKRQGVRSGISTGLTDLDELLDGLQLGEQTIIAARPSMGKTAIGLTVFERACLRDGVPTLFITLEMGLRPLVRRLAAMHCRIPMNSLRRGLLTEGDMAKMATFSALISQSSMVIVDAVNGATDTEIASSIRRNVRLHGIKLVVVDYLQKIRATNKHEKKTYEVAQVSGMLKSVADKCGIALLTIAQLNRESEKGQLPRLCDLADSGQIERDADVVGLLHRDKTDAQKPAKLIIAKNRDGEIGMIELMFLGQFCRFESVAKESRYP